MGPWLWYWNEWPNIPMETSRRNKTDKSTSKYQIQILKFLVTVFFDCSGVVHHEFLPQGRTVNKNHVIVDNPIMNFAPWYRTSIHIDACAWVFGQNQNRNHAIIFIGFGLSWLFPLPKTEATDERKALCYDWRRSTTMQNVITGIWALKPKPNHPNGTVKKSQDRKKHVKFDEMVFLIVFFDCNGVVRHKFLPQSRTANKQYYLEDMSRLREAIRQKRLELWKTE